MIEKPIILVGDGGHCLSVIDVIESSSYYSVAGIIAPNNKKLGSILGYPVIGTDKDLDRLLVDNGNVCVTIGQITTSEHRERLFLKLVKLGANFPVLKSARATVSSHAIIKGGTVVMHGAIVNAAAEVGENCIINSMALIEHNVIVEPHCHISTGAILNGGVHVGSGTFIGSGAVIHHGIQVGKNCIIGSGCVVSKNTSPNTILRYNC